MALLDPQESWGSPVETRFKPDLAPYSPCVGLPALQFVGAIPDSPFLLGEVSRWAGTGYVHLFSVTLVFLFNVASKKGMQGTAPCGAGRVGRGF